MRVFLFLVFFSLLVSFFTIFLVLLLFWLLAFGFCYSSLAFFSFSLCFVTRWLYKSVTIDRIDRYFSLRLSARKTSPEAIQSVHLIYIGYYFDLVVFNDIRLDLIAVAASSSSSFLRSSFPFQWKSEEQSNRNRNVSSHHFFSFVDNSSVELITVFL